VIGIHLVGGIFLMSKLLFIEPRSKQEVEDRQLNSPLGLLLKGRKQADKIADFLADIQINAI
jgi:hypothetical protein